MQKLILSIITLVSCLCFSQQDKAKAIAEKKANNYVYEANTTVNEDFVSAEMAYRKALSQQSSHVAGLYNLGHAYYKEGNYAEALYRHQQTAKLATSKPEKHKAFHNIGNILMQEKKCKEAVEAYKNALRNDPSDDETRYNLGIAKECAKQQEEQNKDNKDDKDKNDDNKEDKDNSEDKKDDNKDNKDDKKDDDKNKKDGDDKDKDEKKDEENDKKEEDKKPEDKDKKDDKGKGDKDKEEQQPKPQQGQLSPQQIKNLLEAMNNQEQEVQEKMNLQKQKGVKIKTEKDW
jgi:tetratricopeptide (TPR) repeat protein